MRDFIGYTIVQHFEVPSIINLVMLLLSKEKLKILASIAIRKGWGANFPCLASKLGRNDVRQHHDSTSEHFNCNVEFCVQMSQRPRSIVF